MSEKEFLPSDPEFEPQEPYARLLIFEDEEDIRGLINFAFTRHDVLGSQITSVVNAEDMLYLPQYSNIVTQ